MMLSYGQCPIESQQLMFHSPLAGNVLSIILNGFEEGQGNPKGGPGIITFSKPEIADKYTYDNGASERYMMLVRTKPGNIYEPDYILRDASDPLRLWGTPPIGYNR